MLGGLRSPRAHRGSAWLSSRADYWQNHATTIHRAICERSWNAAMAASSARWTAIRSTPACCACTKSGFWPLTIRGSVGTVEAVERGLRRGNFVFATWKDDFGRPRTPFICTFWYNQRAGGHWAP